MQEARFPPEAPQGTIPLGQTSLTPPGVREAVHLKPDLYLAAAARLVSGVTGDREQAAKRFLRAAPAHGIDLQLMWGTVDMSDPGNPRVREACLAVPGAGRTAMLFLSGPERGTTPDDAAARRAELIGAIGAASHALAVQPNGRFKIVQALPEPGEHWAISALEGAGFTKVGELDYLRRPPMRGQAARSVRASAEPWPDDIMIRTIERIEPGSRDRELLIAALDRSYAETLDCPELCGLRETTDVLDSHRATGQFDPSLWWIVFLRGEPHGCMLLSRLPEQDCVELVYLGLSPELRGRRIGSRLLAIGLDHAARKGPVAMTCAVDRRNAPAIRLYARFGFRQFSSRVAFVKPL